MTLRIVNHFDGSFKQEQDMYVAQVLSYICVVEEN